MFCLFYDAASKQVRSLNGSGRSALDSSLEQIRRELRVPEGTAGSIPTTSVLSVTVPGAAAGWVDAVERFGSGKLSLAEVLRPAVEMAEGGYPISQLAAYFVGGAEILSCVFAEIILSGNEARRG